MRRVACLAIWVALSPLAAFAQEADRAAPRDVDRDTARAEGPSLLLVDTQTRIESVGFRFTSGSAIDEQDLRSGIATRPAGPLTGIQDALDFIPGIRTPVRPLFSPLALQKDVARIRRQYVDAGFVEAAVDYEARLDTATNRISIDFVVDQGLPLVIDTVVVRWADDASSPEDPGAPTLAPWPPELERAWADQLRRLARARGTRLGSEERSRLELQTAHWFLDRGYPWVSVRSEPGDTTNRAVDLRLVVAPGPRARVDSLVLEGQQRLSEPVIRREIPIRIGDWYDENAVAAGEAELYELELIRRALGGVDPGQPRDTTVTLRFRVEETLPRTIWGRAGWRSEAGVAGEAHWTHRNFLGGARTLTGSTAIETGWAALESSRGWSLGASATMRQPYLWHTRISGTVGPFLRARDDIRDRSFLYGVETAAIYKAGALQTLTLQLEVARLGVTNALELLPVSELVARGVRDYSPSFLRSLMRLNGSYGYLDDRIDPRRGYLIEPSLELTGPGFLTDIQYFRMSLEAVGAVPISRQVGLFARAEAGRLFPFGESDVSGPDLARDVAIGLHDAMFTAGGSGDVRGWGNGLLGPKMPDVRFRDDTGAVVADRYVPVGGLVRLVGSVEVLLPFPLLSESHRTFFFLDAGRVWTPGDDLQPADPGLAVEPWGVGTGGGVQIGTPFGPVRLGLGYKLNPSRVDLLAPSDVARTLAAGGSLESLPTESIRRWHLHLAIGRSL
ncbi:MAG: outer membrane protein assembly factor [Gemmatimonadales bacterium]